MRLKKALIVVNEDWWFVSHRLPLGRGLQDQGYDVHVACRFEDHQEKLQVLGFKTIPVDLARESISPGSALKAITFFRDLYRAEKPDILIHASLFISLLGTIAALWAGQKQVTNLITGLGFVFISESLKARLMRVVVKVAFRIFAKTKKVKLIVQNRDDQALFQNLGFQRNETLYLIRGSGVDQDKFSPADSFPEKPVVTFVGRMLWSKGVAELIEAARLLKSRATLPILQLVGDPDPGNPQSATDQDIEKWKSEGLITYLGRRSDIDEIYKNSTIAVLPSWREGMPKSLLEAAACGLALITTDVPGCRELVKEGKNGLLVGLKNSEELANAIETLSQDKALCQKFGAFNRNWVETELNQEAITQSMIRVIEKTAGSS